MAKADEAKSPDTTDATAAEGAAPGLDGALSPAPAPTYPDLSGEVADLKAQIASLNSAHESEVAGLRSELQAAQSALTGLKAAMVSGAALTAQDADPDALVEVRVKTPMAINPDPDRWDYGGQPIPVAAHTLTRGLNLVPRWVADHWLVKANLEEKDA